MNHRERFIETMTFGRPDRPAAGDYLSYVSTRERWEREGLPKGIDLNEYFGFDFNPFEWKVYANTFIYPLFSEDIIEENHDYIIKRKTNGSIVRILKNEPPPAMPQWVRNTLENVEDWNELKKRLDPQTPGRFADGYIESLQKFQSSSYPVGMWVGGSYGIMRDCWGVENLSVLFYDNPKIIEEMMEYLTHLSLTMLNKALAEGIKLDWVMFWEDMAYKNGSLISPAMFKKYCIPFYNTIMEKVQSAGIPVAMVDSDGDIRELVSMWLDVGVNVMHPMEVASGMDVRDIRKQFGKRVCFFGGIDKRALAASKSDIDKEVIPKLEYCFEEGGYIPACDHGVPPDISFENYCYFRELIRKISDKIYGT